MTLLRCLLITFFSVAIIPATLAQSVRTSGPGSSQIRENLAARALFEEVDSYVKAKSEELRRQNPNVDERVMLKLRQEQQDLATKNVKAMQARGQPAAEDLYYFGRLQFLAGDNAGALESLRLFLATTPSGELVQAARPVAITSALRCKQLSEAEEIANDYAANEPQDFTARIQIEEQLANAFRSASDFEAMASHGKTMYKLIRERMGETGCNASGCEEALVKSAALVADAYLKQNRLDEAIGVMERLQKLAMSRASVQMFLLATARFMQFQITKDPFRVFEDPPNTTQRLPDLDAKDWVDRQPTKLADLRGYVVLLDFWATWCGPCRAGFPDLRKLHSKYNSKGLVIIGVTQYFQNVEGRKVTKEQELAYLRDFKKQNELPYAFAVTDSNAVLKDYEVFGIPTYILIDRSGHIRFMNVGLGQPGNTTLDKMINQLLAESSPSPQISRDQH